MTPKEHLIASLTRLVATHGLETIADEIESSSENLSQIVKGVKLPSGEPRGVGPTLQRKLEAKFPGWAALVAAEQSNADYAGRPPPARNVRVRGTAKLGEGGFYEEIEDGGYIESISRDPDAFALRVKGDSMHPAIRHGHFVTVEPNGRLVPGEYVAIELLDGQKMVKELVFDRAAEVVVESANGNRRLTFDRARIKHIYAVGAIVPPSKWRPD